MTEHDQENQVPETSTAEVIESVRALIGMMNDGGISELDVSTGDVNIRLRSQAASMAAAAPMISMPPQMMQPPMAGWAAYSGLDAGHPDGQANPGTVAEAEPEGHVVSSPMIGTFYAASAPGEPPFVKIGDEVDAGQQIGIIEAMKIMNEITADKSGVVVDILVENAQAVEYGTPLVRISTSARLD